ncbi:MAG: hypothetical protein R3Y23_02120 [Bacillota bacterium]
MIISRGLQYISTLFPHPLYVVGGAVRDFLMGYTPTDYDICSCMPPEQVISLLKNHKDIAVSTTSPKLGTLKISYLGEAYEYTTFRTDSYALDGSHEPQSVAFTTSILEDSLRRDFTVNAIYYDIKNEKTIDPLGRIADVDNHIIRTTRPPQSVFEEDGLRLLRAIRIGAETNCSISSCTLHSLTQNAFRLQKIAVERVADELDKILVSDTKNNIKDTHITAISHLIECGLMQYIFPELLSAAGWKSVLRILTFAPPKIRLAALLWKATTQKSNAKDSAKLANILLTRLRYSTSIIARTTHTIEHHMFNMDLSESKETIHQFVQKHWDIIDDIIALKQADYLDCGVCPSAASLQKVKDDMIAHNVPLKVTNLCVNGNDLIALGTPPAKRGILLTKLLQKASYDYTLITREAQLALLKTLQ